MKFNKLFILMFAMIFLVGTVSAIEWDNRLSYSNNDLKVEIKNAFGLGQTFGTIELKSHSSVDEVLQFGYGKEEVVMYYDFEDWKLYKNGLGEVTFIDRRTGEEVEKDYYFVEWKETQVPNYIITCDKFVNGTDKGDCTKTQAGTKGVLDWVRLDNNDIPGKNARIGLKTYVDKDDYLDGVWTIAGKKVKKHAQWTADLNVDLVYVWDFNQGSGNNLVEKISAINNGTLVNMEELDWSNGTGCILDGCLTFGGTDERISFPTALNSYVSTIGQIDKTWCYWIKDADISAEQSVMDWRGTGISGSKPEFANRIQVSSSFAALADSDTSIALTETGIVNDVWTQVCNTWDVDTGNLTMYVAGEDKGTVTDSGLDDMFGFTVVPTFGARNAGGSFDNFMTAVMDDTFFWNRTLSSSEISDLWNGGAGIAHTTSFPQPTINLDSPTNNTIFSTTNQVVYNATIFSPTNVGNVTFFLNGNFNETNNTITNNTVYTFTRNLAEGFTTSIFQACDSLNNCVNSSIINVTVNTTPNIDYGAGVPVNEFNSTDNFFEVNVTITEDLFLNLTFDLYNVNGALNRSVTFTNSSRGKNFTELPDASYSYNVTVATTTNEFNSTETRNISFDTNFPTIIVTSPTGDQGTFVSGLNLSLNWNATDANLDVCQYDYEGSNTTVACGLNVTNLTVTDSLATTLTFYVNDTFGQVSSNSTSWSYSFAENNVTFNVNSSETDSQFFQINLSTSLNVSAISAQLNYNGSNFISSASCEDFCLVNNTIDISLVSSGETEQKDFFWEISIFNGTDSINVNTSTREQNVTRIHLEECGGAFTTESLNFTVYDEQNLSRINPFLFDGDFDQWLGGGDVKRQSNFSDSSTADLDLCISPTDETFFIDSTIEYDEVGNGTTYTLRNYYFQNNTINNVSEDIFMYLLQSASSTSFILKVQDDALLPVPGVLIQTNRFYPGLNEFRIVQIAKTDGLGKSVGFFETEIVDYKFIISLNNDTLLETGLQKVIPESSPFTLTFNLGENLGQPWGSQTDISNLISTLSWEDSSGIVTYTYVDNSTNLTLARLFVIQQSLVNSSADSTICNVNSSLTSAILTCNVGNDSGFYTASAFITRDSTEALDLQISFQIETLSSVVGLLGLFYGFFLILIASFMFKFNEIAGIWAITIVVLLVNLIGLINFGGVFVTAIIGIAIFLTWLMSN